MMRVKSSFISRPGHKQADAFQNLFRQSLAVHWTFLDFFYQPVDLVLAATSSVWASPQRPQFILSTPLGCSPVALLNRRSGAFSQTVGNFKFISVLIIIVVRTARIQPRAFG
jgi:hypothetical protein